MAKQTALQLVNKILNNLGESSVAALTSLSGISLLVFNTINELLYDIAFEYYYKPLEIDVTLTLGTGTSTYYKTHNGQSGGTALYAWDVESFRYNQEKKISYYTPQRNDRRWVSQTNTNIPDIIYDWGGFFNVYPIPSSGAASKTIKGRGWQLPSVLSTDSPSGTCWIPEGFDLTLLADYVTYKIMHYKHNSEALTYYAKVWGDNRLNEGSYSKFKRLYGSELLSEQIFVEPMEGGSVNGIVQPPITG